MNKVIFGLSNIRLTDSEIEFFKKAKPSGFIIFKRNIESKSQLHDLCQSLRRLYNEEERDKVLILIDQEGGRVQRLTEPLTIKYLAPKNLITPFLDQDILLAKEAVYESNFKMASELVELGINVNCTPLADLCFDYTDNVIGDRSFGSNPLYVAELCKAVIDAHRAAGVEPVIKHIPGHGRARADSHLELPIVDADLKELEKNDFQVFKLLRDYSKYAMSAHIVYTSLDPHIPATLSPKVIEYVRDEIGFKGKIITDCITMKALSGTFAERTEASLRAGCDYVLHCSADLPEMENVMVGVEKFNSKSD